jgi:succinyl-diaminopimelate desuccinylase
VNDLLALTASFVDIPSESFQEGPLTDIIEDRLRSEARWLDVERLGNNLVARTMLGRPLRLVVAGHTDTVPENGNLPSRVDGEVLWGLGSCDMKSGLAVMVDVATAVADPAVDVTWVFYEAEEVSSEHNGLRRLFDERPDLVRGDAALLGEPTDGAIEAGCQGTLRAEVTFGGSRAHTARPWMGRNAIHRMTPALVRLARYEERRPVLDGCEFREAIQAVGVEGGVAGNVVPDRAVLRVNHRFAPDRSEAEAIAHVRELVGSDLDDGLGDRFEVIDAMRGALPNLGHPLLAALVRRGNLAVRAKLGWTDVARFAAHGIPAANFGPGDPTLAHTAGEHVARASIEGVRAALADLLQAGP